MYIFMLVSIMYLDMVICRLHIAVLPMLLHLHQSQLDFLIEFIGGKSTSADSVSQNIVTVESNDSEGCTVTDEALLPFFQVKMFHAMFFLDIIWTPKWHENGRGIGKKAILHCLCMHVKYCKT